MKAYGYCRYSSDLQTEASIEQQKAELIEYANKNNITIIDFYCDEAKSATKDTRENFQLMISDCKQGLVDCVLVWKTDRFARNTQDSLFYKMKLEKLGVKLISITQPIDSSTPEGALMYTLLAGMDEYYSKNLASNVKRALKMNATNCLTNGGTAPLGYDIVNRKYVINEEESKIVKKIYSLYIGGKGLMEIASILNDEGYKTKKGKTFGKNSIYEILSNEKYTGTYIYNKGTGSNRHEKRDDTIRIENAFDAIISKADFNKIKEIRKSHYNLSAKFKNKNLYLLSGLIYCGNCGARYCGSTSTKTKNGITYKTGYYTCANRNKLGKCHNHILKQDEIEEFVYNSLVKKILNGNDADTLFNKIKIEYNKLENTSEETIKKLNINLNNINLQINNLVDIIASTGNATLVAKLTALENEKEDIEEKIQFYKSTSSEITFNKISETINNDLKALTSSSKEEIKPIIQKYIKKIVIYEDRFDIEFTFSENYISSPIRR